MEIEKIVVEEEFNYIDAICYYCEVNNLEIESVTKLISKSLKERLKWDATRLNYMKKHLEQNYLYNEKVRTNTLETSSNVTREQFQ